MGAWRKQLVREGTKVVLHTHQKGMAKIHGNWTDFLYHYGFIGLERKREPEGRILDRWPCGVQGKNNLSKSLQLFIKSCHLPAPSSYLSPVGFFFLPQSCRLLLLAYLLAVGMWHLSVLSQSGSPRSSKTFFGRKEHQAAGTQANASKQQNRIWTLLHVLKTGDLAPEGLSSPTWLWQSP